MDKVGGGGGGGGMMTSPITHDGTTMEIDDITIQMDDTTMNDALNETMDSDIYYLIPNEEYQYQSQNHIDTPQRRGGGGGGGVDGNHTTKKSVVSLTPHKNTTTTTATTTANTTTSNTICPVSEGRCTTTSSPLEVLQQMLQTELCPAVVTTTNKVKSSPSLLLPPPSIQRINSYARPLTTATTTTTATAPTAPTKTVAGLIHMDPTERTVTPGSSHHSTCSSSEDKKERHTTHPSNGSGMPTFHRMKNSSTTTATATTTVTLSDRIQQEVIPIRSNNINKKGLSSKSFKQQKRQKHPHQLQHHWSIKSHETEDAASSFGRRFEVFLSTHPSSTTATVNSSTTYSYLSCPTDLLLLEPANHRKCQAHVVIHDGTTGDDTGGDDDDWNDPPKMTSNTTKMHRPWKRMKTDDDNNYHYRNNNNNTSNTNNEVGYGLGYIWRLIVRYIIVATLDHVNMLRISRILQFQIHFLTFHEAFILNAILEFIQIYAQPRTTSGSTVGNRTHTSMLQDTPSLPVSTPRQRKQSLHRLLRHAFQNRNVSRLIVQVLRARYDYFYHWPFAVRYNRYFDMIGQFPVIGSVTRFPATENFPATRNHALASIFRILLGPGNWCTRVITGGRQGLITDDPNHPAQNLTAEANNFELANRNQYGNYYGRKYTNQFRFEHRLPIDESLIRTFITVPIPTMVNNGVVHTLRQLAKHWYNMVHVQTYGNFAHQRMEQLSPFETIRIHIPAVLLTLASLRGRNIWDRDVLSPFMNQCTNLDVDTDTNNSGIEKALYLMQELGETIAIPVSGGIPTVYEPLLRWIAAVEDSLLLIQAESEKVFDLVASVELGIRCGYDIITQTDWKVPSDTVLINAIHDYIVGANVEKNKNNTTTMTVDDHLISNALERTTPRDKRTLIELVQNHLAYSRPAQLLIKRVKTLLQREMRRHTLNTTIIQMSKGDYLHRIVVTDTSRPEYQDIVLRVDDWYWLESKKHCELYLYCGPEDTSSDHNIRSKHKFRHVASKTIKIISMKGDALRHFRVRRYIPVGEAISRAQKVLMTIELDHGKKFSYNAFMEFHRLRIPLQRLLVVGQMTCEELDNARLTLLSEIQQSSRLNRKMNPKKDIVEPQNITVVGGGPGGMMACLHCIENCLASGGEMKLFEARDTFSKGGSTYERAQIVRLDARWIATMRYHLGTGFEDVFIPASGETDAQLGNTL